MCDFADQLSRKSLFEEEVWIARRPKLGYEKETLWTKLRLGLDNQYDLGSITAYALNESAALTC
jgi:hypothetical protein